MAVTIKQIEDMISTLVARGLGIYGREKMGEICLTSGVALLDDNTTDWLTEDIETALNKFLVNYAKFNIAAKMTVMVLAKKYGIELPEELQRKKKRKSKFRRLLEKVRG
ncbi:MAG: hypothetical protein GF411_11740 [Candidatus Lokiarchaeota archaeon]|nr:hypothetical protein [Candidatus Lokiarchaeota archaeon]